MLILGIDPGIATTGYALVKVSDDQFKIIDLGCIRTTPNLKKSERLKIIYSRLHSLINEHNPNTVAVEKLFFCKNAKTAISIGESRGIILLAAADFNLPVFEYTPLQVKEVLSGYGRASKNQIKDLIQAHFNLKKRPSSDDAADAAAIALCHIFKTEEKCE